MPQPSVAVACGLDTRQRAVIAGVFAGTAEAVYLVDLDGPGRQAALRDATVLLAWNTAKDLRAGEADLLRGARLIQFMTAGVDFIPLGKLPATVPIACNGGAYAEPMAEHALALALAAAKRLPIEHAALARGQFNQFVPNRMLAGGVCGILGFGGVGTAAARLGAASACACTRSTAAAVPARGWIGSARLIDSGTCSRQRTSC